MKGYGVTLVPRPDDHPDGDEAVPVAKLRRVTPLTDTSDEIVTSLTYPDGLTQLRWLVVQHGGRE